MEQQYPTISLATELSRWKAFRSINPSSKISFKSFLKKRATQEALNTTDFGLTWDQFIADHF
jgi:hypothetical protein